MIQGKLIITFEAYNIKHIVEMGDEASTEEILDVVNSMLIGLTYAPKTIEDAVVEWAERITGIDYDRTANTNQED
jgi:predicted aconitase